MKTVGGASRGLLLSLALAAAVVVASVSVPAAGEATGPAGGGPPGAPATEATPASTCRLPRAPGASDLDEGPSDFSWRLRPSGAVKALILFVDFPDHPQTGPVDAYVDQLAGGAAWFDEVSYGRVDLQVTPVHQWFRMPQASTAYAWPTQLSFANHRTYIADAIAAADPSVDFGPYDLVYIVPPQGATAISFSPAFIPQPGSGIQADGGEILHAVTFGQDMWFWGFKVLNHETGHLFSLPDLYAYQGDQHGFVGEWDLMGLINGGAPGLMAWHRWKLGWIDNGQIACVADVGVTEHEISPLAQPGGVEALVVRTGPHTAYVAEYRRNLGVDAGLCDDGLLVYRVDTWAANGSGPIRVMDAQPSATDTGCPPLGNAPFEMGPGEQAVFADATAGVTIEVIDRTDDEITVRVEVEPAPGRQCAGRQVTVDLARGQRPTNGPDVILGRTGSDTITAGGGDDLVCPGGGSDTVDGGVGADRILGAGGADTLRGGLGPDTLDGGPGGDVLTGQGGPDRLLGGPQRDRCDGGPDRDTQAGCEVRTSIP